MVNPAAKYAKLDAGLFLFRPGIKLAQVSLDNLVGVAPEPGHLISHIEDYAYPFQVDPATGQSPYELEALDIVLRVAPPVALGARGRYKPLLFIDTQSSRVKSQQIGGNAQREDRAVRRDLR